MCPKISRERVAARQAQILDAARACFVRNGFHPTTIDDVAAESGLSVGSIYKYFPSKEHMFLSIADEDFQRLDSKILGGSRGAGPPDKVIRAAIERFLEGVASRGESWGPIYLEFRAVARSRPDLADPVEQLTRRFHRRLVRLLEQGVSDGTFRSDLDPRAVAYLIVAALDGFTLHTAVGKPPVSPSKMLDVILDVLAPT